MGFFGDVGKFFKDTGKKLAPIAEVGADIVSAINPSLGKPVSAGVDFVADKTGANKQKRPQNPGHPPIFNRKNLQGTFKIMGALRDRAQAQSQKELVDFRPALIKTGIITPTSDNVRTAAAPARVVPGTTPAFQQVQRRDNTGTLVAMAAVVGLGVLLMMRRR